MNFMKQMTVIFTISFVAELMEFLIPLPVAASIYGLVLMTAGLMTGIIPLEKVERAADFLVEILPILFVPPTVSIMTAADEMRQMLIPLCVISVVSTVVVMAVTGRVSQALIRIGGKSSGQGTETARRTTDGDAVSVRDNAGNDAGQAGRGGARG